MLDNTRVKAELTHIHGTLATIMATERGRPVMHELRTKLGGGTASAIVRQALFADCLRVVHAALAADDTVDEQELEATYELVFSIARHYAGVVPAYGEFDAVTQDTARTFLAHYAADAGLFGHGAAVRWPGLELCRRTSELGEPEPLERYERLMSWLITEACATGGVARVDELDELRRELAGAVTTVAAPSLDLRAQTFLGAKRVFASVQQASSVFDNDPFDVETVHADARASFERMVERATTPVLHGERGGRILLVLGDSGAGKTHLLRAFRRHVQEYGRGFVAYAQLQSRAEDYSRYLLQHVVDSLARPYAGPAGERTGLHELASGLPRLVGGALAARIHEVMTGDGDADEVNKLVDELLRENDLATFDPDLIRVMLYALRLDPRTASRVYKYLRCEDMTAHDRRWIGDVIPRIDADHPVRMIREIGRLAWTTQQAALVLMVDQAEIAGFDADSAVSFRRAIDAIYNVVSEVPSAVAVIACLGDLWTSVRGQLVRSALDRLENDPPVERLAINRTYPEIEAIVARRLAWLYAEANVAHRPEAPVYPIPEGQLRAQANRRTRDVLDWCHRFQEKCAHAGKIVDDSVEVTTPAPQPPPPDTTDLDRIAAAWNDACHASGIDIPDDEDAILALVVSAARGCSAETGTAIEAALNAGFVTARIGSRTTLEIGLTNKGPQRNAFGTQLEKLRSRAGSATPVAIRTLAFPTGKASSEATATFLKAGGKKQHLDAATLRVLVAHEQFRPPFPADRIAAWRKRDRPLATQAALAHLFELDGGLVIEPIVVAEPPPHPTASPAPTPAVVAASGELHVGTTTGFRAEPRTLAPAAMLRHTAVLGTTGSGKTTLALNLLEQLLERDIPVVLVDRKGDLAGYAQPGWWERAADPARAKKLADRLDVRLFTPGTRGGRPLALTVVPDLGDLPEHDRSREVHYAANALAGMMRFGAGGADQARRAILVQAITVLADRKAPAGLGELIEMLEERDDELIARAGRYDDKLFKRLVQDLETVRLNDGELFADGAESLTAETLIGRTTPGKTPLAIASTRFLGSIERVQAWAAHLVGCLNRHAVKHPRADLSTVLMLDEADVFMPAGTAKPPSKEPLQDMLRRSRSTGFGVVLASQSPADFDYKSRDLINTWFVGTVKEKVAIDKIKPLFEHKPQAGSKLGTLEPGRFLMLHAGDVQTIERAPCLLRTEQLGEAELLELARTYRPA